LTAMKHLEYMLFRPVTYTEYVLEQLSLSSAINWHSRPTTVDTSTYPSHLTVPTTGMNAVN